MRNLIKREFARMVGKRPSEISRWLAGTHNFTLATIAKIEITLGTNLINIEH
jgi:transcriptional regulator with XRE-family HTH domain